MIDKAIVNAVRAAALEGTDPAGGTYMYLPLSTACELAERYDLPPRQVELTALGSEIVPEKYQRNMGTIGLEGQMRLLRSTVGVIGAGGLGGFVLELLARMGVGRLIVVDGDSFAESNLNRQLLATERNLGESKAAAAAKRINQVNGSVEVIAFHRRGDAANMPELFADCNLVVDCLDNLPSRFELEKACGNLGIIMVHGAIAGFIGQIAVIRPERPLLSLVYGTREEGGAQRGIEVRVGNPAVTPAMLASWQSGEVVKILAGLEGVIPPDQLMIFDMQSGDSYKVAVDA